MFDSLLVFYSNFVPKMHCFWDIQFQICHDLENWVSGPPRSLKTSPFDRAPMTSYYRSKATMGLSCTVSEIVKITQFLTPRVFCTPAEEVPLGIGYQHWGQKTRMMWLPDRERTLTISSAIWIQSTNVTDGQTPGDSKDHTYA